MEWVSEEATLEEAGKTKVRWEKLLISRAVTHGFGWPRAEEDPQCCGGLYKSGFMNHATNLS